MRRTRKMLVLVGGVKLTTLRSYLIYTNQYDNYDPIRRKLHRKFPKGDVVVDEKDEILQPVVDEFKGIPIYRIYLMPNKDGKPDEILVNYSRYCSYDSAFEILSINPRTEEFSTNHGKTWTKVKKDVFAITPGGRQLNKRPCAVTGRCTGCMSSGAKNGGLTRLREIYNDKSLVLREDEIGN